MAFLDYFRKARPVTNQTLGAPGFMNFGGYVVSNEQDKRLTGNTRYITYSDMLVNTSIVAAGTRYFLGLISKAGWRAVPSDKDNAESERIAEAIQKVLDEMDVPWHRVVRRAAMYKFYGFSVQEWTARRMEDGTIGLREISSRPQHTIEKWDTDLHGRVLGVVQRSPQTGREIPLRRDKLVYLVDDALTDSPEGIGLFRHLVSSAARMKRFEQLEAFGYETDLRGIPLGRAPLSEIQDKVKNGDLSPAQATALTQPLTNFIERHIKNPELGMMLDSITYQTLDEKGQPSQVPKWDLKLVTGDNASPMSAVASAIERLNREMARIMGVEHLLLGGDGKGSLALSRDKTQAFGLMVDSALTEIGEQTTDDVCGPLMDMNGWPRELRPNLVPQPTKYRDVEQVTSALKQMADSGAVLHPEDPAIGEVRELLGLSAPNEVISPTLAEGELEDKKIVAQTEQAKINAKAQADAAAATKKPAPAAKKP